MACPWFGTVVMVVVMTVVGVLRATSGPVSLLFRVPQDGSGAGLTTAPTTPCVLGSVELLPVVLANAKSRRLLMADGPFQQSTWEDV